ncbi:SurA N-terminal domain-containing protein [Abditibacterium utsteinense]|uniref:SurA N-terminal domain-containing protein n=1 Tax=Abditibacterium utsteinense TaxID=1960156 RepID=A0A2S8SUN1_9BACT|nr:SurA N-terminal domain-containing protein [Abditibacterium utsteinense]PQV64469.1 SurA N-terminal domain-containing protein [Abditibacterium utsteinense]
MAVKNNTPTPRPTNSRKVVEPLSSEVYKEEKPSPLSIEGIRSGAVQSKVFKGFILLSGLVMAGGLIISGLSPTGQAPNGAPRAATNQTIAKVGQREISGLQLASTFERQMQMNAQFGQKTGVTDYLRSKQQALQGLTDNASTVLAAQAAGIAVSDADVDKDIERQISEVMKPQQGQTEATFRRLIEAQYGSVQAAREKMMTTITPAAREEIKAKLLTDGLEKQIKDVNKITEDDYKRSVTKLKLWQIVVRPKLPALGAKDPKIEAQKNNREAARRGATLFAGLKTTPTLANFQATAKKSSDDLVTKAKGGDFGWKLPAEIFYGPEIGESLSKTAGDLAGPFADASGNQYIFFIENRKTELPKDYAKNKKKLLADFETQADNTAWQKRQEEYKKAQTPEISDDALAAYQIQSTDLQGATGDAQKTLRADAIARYEDALKGAGGVEAAAINYQLSQLYRDQNDKVKQQEALEGAVKSKGDDAALRLEYARTLRDGGKPKDALAQLKAASTALDASPAAPSPFGGGNPDDALRQQIAGEYDALKDAKSAQAERAKIKPAAPGGMTGMNGLPPGMTINPQ